MDLSEIRKIVRLMLSAELSELEIDDKNTGVRLHIKRPAGGGEEGAAAGPLVHWMAPPGAMVPGAAAPAAGAAAGAASPGAPAATEGELPPGTEAVKSPMVGTFYRAPSPDADNFVELGTRVADDSVLCIIEAMKVMNEIRSEIAGEVLEILVENGEPVEFGQPLFLIKKG